MLDGVVNLEPIFKFEPMLHYLLDDSQLVDLEIRILTIMFRSGGYITLNHLTEQLDLPPPPVSIAVASLAKKKYLRKNRELMPIALVLLVSIRDLKTRLDQLRSKQQYATEFLLQLTDLSDVISLKSMAIRAFATLFPDEQEPKFAVMLFELYTHDYLDKETLYQTLTNSTTKNKSKNKNKISSAKVENKYEELLLKYPKLIQIIYKKYRRKDTYLRAQIPISSLAHIRGSYLRHLNTLYQDMIEELEKFMYRPFEAIISHQVLQFHSDIKTRIDTCLKQYHDIQMIYNGIYRKKTKKSDIIELLTSSNILNKHHRIRILSRRKKTIRTLIKPEQINQKLYSNELDLDFQNRDIILFEQHGCVVIPVQDRAMPYYSISPQLIKTVTNSFEMQWSQ